MQNFHSSLSGSREIRCKTSPHFFWDTLYEYRLAQTPFTYDNTDFLRRATKFSEFHMVFKKKFSVHLSSLYTNQLITFYNFNSVILISQHLKYSLLSFTPTFLLILSISLMFTQQWLPSWQALQGHAVLKVCRGGGWSNWFVFEIICLYVKLFLAF